MKYLSNNIFGPTEAYKLIALLPYMIGLCVIFILSAYQSNYFWLGILIILPIILFKYLIISSIYYSVDKDALRIKTGLFNKDINFIRLERVIDIEVTMPFIYSIFGLYFLHVHSVDKLKPHLLMVGLDDQSFVDHLNILVDKARSKSRIIETV